MTKPNTILKIILFLLTQSISHDFFKSYSNSIREKPLFAKFPQSNSIELYGVRASFNKTEALKFINRFGGSFLEFSDYNLLCVPKEPINAALIANFDISNKSKSDALETFNTNIKDIIRNFDETDFNQDLSLFKSLQIKDEALKEALNLIKISQIVNITHEIAKISELVDAESEKNHDENNKELLIRLGERIFNLKIRKNIWEIFKNENKKLFEELVKENESKNNQNDKEDKERKVEHGNPYFYGYEIYSAENYKNEAIKNGYQPSEIESMILKITILDINIRMRKGKYTAEIPVKGGVVSEPLEDIHKRLENNFKGKCFEKDGYKICPFDKIFFKNDFFRFKKEIDYIKDFSTDNFDLSFSTVFSFFSFEKKKHKKSDIKLSFRCDQNLTGGDYKLNISRNLQQIVFQTAKACVKESNYTKYYEYSYFDPDSVLDYLEITTVDYPCDTYTDKEYTYKFCINKDLIRIKKNTIEILGKYKRDEIKFQMVRISGDNESTFASTILANGEQCQDKNEPYRTKLIFVCYDGLMFLRKIRILSVEKEDCTYIVKIGSKELCSLPFFKKDYSPKTLACFKDNTNNKFEVKKLLDGYTNKVVIKYV